MTYLIYKYTFPNGKVYIGQTYKGSKRLNSTHEYKGQVVYNAMNKYKTWDTEILVECPEHLADWWETSMIKIHDSMKKEKGYNRSLGGHKNRHHSDETKKKISESMTGKSRKFMNYNIGYNNPNARSVYIIDTLNNEKEYYLCIKDIIKNHPEWSYNSIKYTLKNKSLFKKRYKIIYSED